MKTFTKIFMFAFAFAACQKDAVVPEKLVGKWNHTYQIQTKTTDGSWSQWQYISTFAALAPIEFTANGRFLRDGKDGAECCSAGNKFTVVNEKIIFSDLKSCPYASCMPCSEWGIPRLDTDTLVVESCGTRVKYSRAK